MEEIVLKISIFAFILKIAIVKLMKKNRQAQHLDLEEVLKAKVSNRKIPKFIIRYLNKIVHVDEVNHIFKTYAGFKNLDFIERLLDYFQITYTVEGLENFPKDDNRCIFASNHPLGGMDGIVLAYVLGKECDGKLRLLTNDVLLFIEQLCELFIPVNKVGMQGKENAEKLNEFYESDDNLITFPSGKCSRKTKGEIIDPEWKKNFIAKAVQHKRDIIPIYFEGRNSNFFYNLASIRTKLGIKMNLEMLYLADELFKQRNAHFTIKIGKSVPWQTFDKSKSLLQWAEQLKETVYKMK